MKKILATVLVLGLAAAFVGCGNNADEPKEDTQQEEKAPEANAERDEVSQKALDIALQDAGVTEADVTGIKIKPDDKDGQPIHEVKFYQDYKSFEYEIADADGAILDKEVETGEKATDSPNAAIKVAEAEEAARAAGNVPEDVVLVSSETDDDDGAYEFKFAGESGTYEITVDYNNKSIIENKHSAA